METGILDRNGDMIMDGDIVSLDGNITSDNSMGDLPNGYLFDEKDVFQVYYDDRVKAWSLNMGMQPDSRENCHYMSHAVSLLHDSSVTIVRNQA